MSMGGVQKSGPCGIRLEGGVNLDQALLRNRRTCRPDAKEDDRSGSPRKVQSTNAGHRARTTRSRDEGAVMALDRRGCEPPIVCRKPRSKDTGLWKRTNVETDIHLKCASVLCGWCSSIRLNLTANLLRSSRSRLRSVAGRIRFERGFDELRRTAGDAIARPTRLQ